MSLKKARELKRKQLRVTNLCLIILAMSQFLDFHFTYKAVSSIGLSAEGNPIVVFIMESLGVLPGLILTKVLALIVLVILYKARKKITCFYVFVLLTVTVLYIGCVVTWFYIWSFVL